MIYCIKILFNHGPLYILIQTISLNVNNPNIVSPGLMAGNHKLLPNWIYLTVPRL